MLSVTQVGDPEPTVRRVGRRHEKALLPGDAPDLAVDPPGLVPLVLARDNLVRKNVRRTSRRRLRQSVAWMAQQLMEAEVSGKIGAELGERSLERITHRNGYRPRVWDTRVGSIGLAIPKLRTGSYFPSFLEPAGGPSRPWSPSSKRPT
jgi:Transposase, Mutator family